MNLTRKTNFLEGGSWSWFKFDHLGLVLGIALKFYRSETKYMKVKLWEQIATFLGVAGQKLAFFSLLLSTLNLNKVNPNKAGLFEGSFSWGKGSI